MFQGSEYKIYTFHNMNNKLPIRKNIYLPKFEVVVNKKKKTENNNIRHQHF